MILPKKHINFSQSLLGLGSYVLRNLASPKSIDDLWRMYTEDYKKENYPAKHSFDNLVMTILFLHNVDLIIENKGLIKKCN